MDPSHNDNRHNDRANGSIRTKSHARFPFPAVGLGWLTAFQAASLIRRVDPAATAA